MTLKVVILEAIDLTRRLQVALGMDDLDLCRDLLELRGEAMLRFETAHRVATSQEHAVCSSYLRELFEEDRNLQESTLEKFGTAQQELRANLGSATTMHSRSYAAQPQTACLDRKA